MTLTEFLLARIAEDEAIALRGESKGGTWTTPGPGWGNPAVECLDTNETVVYDEGRPTVEQAAHIARHDPARVMAECEAKRRIVEHAPLWGCANTMGKFLALPYAYHPDYREEWKP